MKATLIITVYKDVYSLQAVLRSALLQVNTDFEIIVAQDADDDCFSETIALFQQQGLAIQWLQQEDTGFRKNRMLNQAIQKANTDCLIFIDGDCILHPNFINVHSKTLQKGSFCVGRRVNLDAITSEHIKSGRITHPSFWEMLRNKTNSMEESWPILKIFDQKEKMLLGCNMSFHKEDLIALNGFDEDYVFPGYGEDTDIEFRALKMGLKKKSVRYRAIQYHLFHERPNREDETKISRELFEKKQLRKDYQCENGIRKFIISETLS